MAVTPDRAALDAWNRANRRARDAYTGNTPEQIARRAARIERQAVKSRARRARKKEQQQ